MGAGEAARDEQQGGPRGGWGFGGGLQASRCREAGISLGKFGCIVVALLMARVGGGECNGQIRESSHVYSQ